MATWQGLFGWQDGDPLLAQQLATYVNGNLEYLLKPNSFYVYDGGTYTTTSNSFVNVAAQFSVSMTTYGGRILCGATAWVDPTNLTDLAIGVDGANETLVGRTNGGTGTAVMSAQRIFLSLAPGAHLFQLRWRVLIGSPATMRGADNAGVAIPPIHFWGIEI